MSEASMSLSSRANALTAFKRGAREYGLLLSLIVIMVFFQVATGGALLQPLNLTNLLLQNSYIVVMALGMLMVSCAGISTCRWARWWAWSVPSRRC